MAKRLKNCRLEKAYFLNLQFWHLFLIFVCKQMCTYRWRDSNPGSLSTVSLQPRGRNLNQKASSSSGPWYRLFMHNSFFLCLDHFYLSHNRLTTCCDLLVALKGFQTHCCTGVIVQGRVIIQFRVLLTLVLPSAIRYHWTICKMFGTDFYFVLMSQSQPLFSLFVSFQQLTIILVLDDLIWTVDLWYKVWPFCHLSHNHWP